MKLSVKQARIGARKTQQEIADEMGVHVQTYRRMEENPEDMTFKQGALFASIVGLEVEDIFFKIDSN